MNVVAEARDLLPLVELENIVIYELRAKLLQRDDEQQFEEGYEIKASLNLQPRLIQTRFALMFEARSARYFVDLAASYSISDEVEVPQEVAVEFVEKVGIMAAFPYLRENLFGLATRLGEPVPVLGILRQGDFSLTPDQAAPGPETPQAD